MATLAFPIQRMAQLRVLWHGERIHVPIAVEEPGPGIDTPEDLCLVVERSGKGSLIT